MITSVETMRRFFPGIPGPRMTEPEKDRTRDDRAREEPSPSRDEPGKLGLGACLTEATPNLNEEEEILIRLNMFEISTILYKEKMSSYSKKF
jgi:hypothetical protein